MLKRVIGADNYQGYDNQIEGIKNADLGTDKVSVPDYISKDLGGPTTEQAKAHGQGTGFGRYPESQLRDDDYRERSHWNYTANNQLKKCYELSNYTVQDGDVLRFQFSLMNGPDINGCEKDTDNVLVEISNKDELTKAMAEVNSDKDTLMAVPEVKAAYDKAVELISAMVTPQDEINTAAAELKKAVENAQGGGENEDQKAADAVIEKIDAIGEVTLESEAAIKEARTAYDKLTEAQKKLVTNYGKLTEAEKKLAELKEQAADQKAADAVIELRPLEK